MTYDLSEEELHLLQREVIKDMLDMHHIHFIGIGGSGMSPIARIFLDMGFEVSGSDLKGTEVTAALKRKGARVFIGHRGDNVGDADVVVASAAIPSTNEELIYAKEHGIPILQRIEVLAMLMEDKYAIAVTGAHGKTTTTSMIALALEGCGLDPTVLIGGELNDIGGSAKLGRSKYLVAEADESSGQFLKLSPQVAVVTNIDDDHLDYYNTIDGVRDAFKTFLGRIRRDGFAVVCIDNPNVSRVVKDYRGRLVTYGLSSEADVRAIDIVKSHFGSRSTVVIGGIPWLELELNVPGTHNIYNALAVAGVAKELGLDPARVGMALSAFKGVHRRFEVIGRVGDITIIDDYGHHPTEIRATLRSAKETEANRVVVIFQPHRYTRTKFLMKEFARAFSDADVILITRIYSAGEAEILGVTGEEIARLIAANEVGKEVRYIPDMGDIVEALGGIIRPGDLVLTLGAGNIREVGEELLARLSTPSL